MLLCTKLLGFSQGLKYTDKENSGPWISSLYPRAMFHAIFLTHYYALLTCTVLTTHVVCIDTYMHTYTHTLLTTDYLLYKREHWLSFDGSVEGKQWFRRSTTDFSLFNALGFRDGSDGKECRRPRFDSLVRKIPERREWQPTPVFLPGESHEQRSLVGYSPWGCKESEVTERLALHFHPTCHSAYSPANKVQDSSSIS